MILIPAFFHSRSTGEKQPYDKVHKTLLAPLLSGEKGYWTTFNWDEALTLGNKTLNLPFSGEFDFVETTYAFPITPHGGPQEQSPFLHPVPQPGRE